MAVDTLRRDLSQLTEVKELVAMVLKTFEDPSFTCAEQGEPKFIVGTLNQVASLPVVLVRW